MLFNSLGFLFLFLPVALVLYYALFARAARLRQLFLITLTLIFYTIGAQKTVVLLLVSIVANYLLARVISRPGISRLVSMMALLVGILFDIGLLFYFKYMNFFLGAISGGTLAFHQIALPLGISFFTFQQIGFLVDLFRRRFEMRSALDYFSFVLFFPQLLAGPIVRYEETVPQLAKPAERNSAARNMLIGMMLVALGLFKKAAIADTLAYVVNPVFERAIGGASPGLAEAWIAAFAYTAQIYFDFSGYSDMALGVARMFGIVLPLNFYSPLRSAGIIELWRRWHITLGRWVQSYVFQPMSLPLARFAGKYAPGTLGTSIFSFALPTTISMVIVGLWHGAGWTFIVFGLLQGFYMIVNEYWLSGRRRRRKAAGIKGAIPPAAWARAVTLVAFVIATVTFRAPDMASAARMYAGMLGLGEGALGAQEVLAQWPLGLAGAVGALLLVYAVVLFAPNSQQIMTRYEPVLEWPRWLKTAPSPTSIAWRMTPGWTLFGAVAFFIGFVFMMRGTTAFIYFNF